MEKRFSMQQRNKICGDAIRMYSLSLYGRVSSRKTYSAYPGDVRNQFFIV